VLIQLKTIECMDVAEQSLHALELLSHKHSKVILQAVSNTDLFKYDKDKDIPELDASIGWRLSPRFDAVSRSPASLYIVAVLWHVATFPATELLHYP